MFMSPCFKSGNGCLSSTSSPSIPPQQDPRLRLSTLSANKSCKMNTLSPPQAALRTPEALRASGCSGSCGGSGPVR